MQSPYVVVERNTLAGFSNRRWAGGIITAVALLLVTIVLSRGGSTSSLAYPTAILGAIWLGWFWLDMRAWRRAEQQMQRPAFLVLKLSPEAMAASERGVDLSAEAERAIEACLARHP